MPREDWLEYIELCGQALAEVSGNVGASRFTSHFQGACSVSSKSLMSKNQAPLRRAESAEVAYVTVPAGLHAQASLGRGRQVRGHQSVRPAKKRKSRLAHALVANGQKLGQPAAFGTFQQFDRIGAFSRPAPFRMCSARYFLSQSFSSRKPFFQSGNCLIHAEPPNCREHGRLRLCAPSRRRAYLRG